MLVISVSVILMLCFMRVMSARPVIASIVMIRVGRGGVDHPAGAILMIVMFLGLWCWREEQDR